MSKLNENDILILDLKKQVEEKKSKIGNSTKFNPITNCELVFNNVKYNIHTLDKQSILLLIVQLSILKDNSKKLYPDEELILNGYKLEDWITDLQSKFDNLNVKTEKERLKKIEERLNNLLSIDTKINLEINELKNLI